MLSKNQAATMLALQANMNAKVDPNWITARYPYLRAVAIEGAEAIEHHGWKWWKKQDKDLSQLQMELVDIWHFILSEILLRNDDNQLTPLEYLLSALSDPNSLQLIELDNTAYKLNETDLVTKLELLIAISIARRIDLGLFESIMRDCELTWTDLFCQYVGKNVLNMFRQDNGYKEGTYRKMWEGREDNEHLVEILESLDPDLPSFKDEIYSALTNTYPI
ncbi:MAG: dUTP diphosphatase [Pseudomonadota bacterium]|nr:dUTP diphosphatase [Pseudomonadales bacterium]MEE3237376.1 dUTP diphosphatase [Pseudomonadota bacterium]